MENHVIRKEITKRDSDSCDSSNELISDILFCRFHPTEYYADVSLSTILRNKGTH